jgi:uncharacterized protein YceK
MKKGIAVILVVALSLSGCAALDAAHMAWQGALIAGTLMDNIRVKAAPPPSQKAPSSEAAER